MSLRLQTTKNTLKNPKLILKELTSFYKQLYSDANDVPTNDMINYIDSMNLPNLKKTEIFRITSKAIEEFLYKNLGQIVTQNCRPNISDVTINWHFHKKLTLNRTN